MIFTPQGEVCAGDLEVGSEVLIAVEDDAQTEELTSEYESSAGFLGDRGAPATALARRSALRAVSARVARKYIKMDMEENHRFDIEVEGNHTYLVDGVVVHNSPETTAGGRALKFYASVRLDIRRIATLKEGESAVGNRTKVKVVKNKLAAPFREAEFDIIYGEGISREGDLMDLGVAHNVVEKSGSWFSYKGERIGQGRENAKQFLKDNADIRQQLETEVRKYLGLIKPEPVNGGANPPIKPEPLQAARQAPASAASRTR
jgi:recombination protein RecA